MKLMRKTVVLLSTIMLLTGMVLGTSALAAARQELTVGAVADPHNWDPMDVYLVNWSVVATSVFEGLVERDLDMKVKPGLAESWDIIDNKTIRFHLRKGITFHSGDAFMADSVKFTFDRILDKDSKSPQKGNYSAISEIKIIDDYTVDFLLKETDPVLIVKLSGYAGVIVPKKYIEEKGDDHFNTNPVGTGPFKMVEYQRDVKVVLERFDGYWKKPLPKLDKVTFRFIPEASTRLAELQTGNIDIAYRTANSQALIIQADKNLELLKVDSPTVYSLRLDSKRKPTDDVRVRQALAYAIDLDTIIETVMEGNGGRINSFQSKLSFGYDSNIPLRAYDPEKALALLKEANYDFNQTLTITVPSSDADFKEFVQATQIYFKKIGVKTNLQVVEFNVVVSDMVPNRKAGHMFRQGWGGWTLDFDNTAYLLYHIGERWNPDLHDEEVERLLAAERSTMDQNKRAQIFSDLCKRLNQITPDIPFYQKISLWGINKHVKGFQAPADDRLRFEKVYMED